MSKPAAEFRAIREEELHDGYTYSGGAYGRRVHYLPPGFWNSGIGELGSAALDGALHGRRPRRTDMAKDEEKEGRIYEEAQIETAKLALDEASFPTISEMQKGQSRVRRMSQANPGTTGERLPLLASRSFRANTHNAKWQDKKLPGVTVSGPPRRFRDKMMEPVDIHSIERGMPGRVKKITTSTPSTGSQVLADLLQRPCVGGIPDMGAHLLA
eukprot:CAMPEP_0114311094 /NCGR_PEP_ID=MMETSP0059-20121206/19630_1 /TAXON_ID=36894 /ORGANISM="Pyramimonas parkeae, Strain CCMP726" /LENGTH=212 /DNA_ID=CAMNT_0001435223 /DNA_START=278 /DNA_END=918 /DNA_ORIENTATION=+